MEQKDRELIENSMDFISFKDLVEEITGSPFDKIYTGMKEEYDNEECDLG